MPDTITADDAEHRFAEVLREVAGGKEFVVTRDGVPVARIVPEGTERYSAGWDPEADGGAAGGAGGPARAVAQCGLGADRAHQPGATIR